MSHLQKCDIFVRILHTCVTNTKCEDEGSTKLYADSASIACLDIVICQNKDVNPSFTGKMLLGNSLKLPGKSFTF